MKRILTNFAMGIIQLNWNDMPSDILDRIQDTEIYTDETINGIPEGKKLYSVKWVHDLLTNDEDDTNDSTRDKLQELYADIQEYDYFLIVNEPVNTGKMIMDVQSYIYTLQELKKCYENLLDEPDKDAINPALWKSWNDRLLEIDRELEMLI